MRMIARRLSLLVPAVMVSGGVVSYGGSRTDLPPGTVQLRGAGSTFAVPLYKTWLDAYQKRHPQMALRYEAIGSGEGTQQFLSGAVDFGASDAAMTKVGQFIQPHGGSGLAILLNFQMPENFRAFAPDPDGEDSYPIVTYSWLLLYRRYEDPQKVSALKAYVTWCLMDGQEFSESLGFVRLPPRVTTRAAHAVAGIQ
jgi:ABC-type phosphate transport system substrate-binding protein